MFICTSCGSVFDTCDNEVCPDCGSHAIDDAVRCGVCGKWIALADASGSQPDYVCRDCLDYRKHDLDFLLKATERYKVDIEIPDLFRYVLDDDEIYNALYRAVETKKKHDDSPFWHVPGFYEFDTDDFVDYYADEIGEAICDERRANDHREDARVAESAS